MAKGRKTCGKAFGHADIADKRTKGLEQEIARVSAQYNALLLERGPRCQHSAEGADARLVRLQEEAADVNVRMQAKIAEQEAELNRYRLEEEAFFDERQAWSNGFRKREQAEWKRVWRDVEAFYDMHDVPTPWRRLP